MYALANFYFVNALNALSLSPEQGDSLVYGGIVHPLPKLLVILKNEVIEPTLEVIAPGFV